MTAAIRNVFEQRRNGVRCLIETRAPLSANAAVDRVICNLEPALERKLPAEIDEWTSRGQMLSRWASRDDGSACPCPPPYNSIGTIDAIRFRLFALLARVRRHEAATLLAEVREQINALGGRDEPGDAAAAAVNAVVDAALAVIDRRVARLMEAA